MYVLKLEDDHSTEWHVEGWFNATLDKATGVVEIEYVNRPRPDLPPLVDTTVVEEHAVSFAEGRRNGTVQVLRRATNPAPDTNADRVYSGTLARQLIRQLEDFAAATREARRLLAPGSRPPAPRRRGRPKVQLVTLQSKEAN